MKGFSLRFRQTDLTGPLIVDAYTRNGPHPEWDQHTTSTERVGFRKTIQDCLSWRFKATISSGGIVPVNPVIISSVDTTVEPLTGTLTWVKSPSYVVSDGQTIGDPLNPYRIPFSIPPLDEGAISHVVNGAIQKSKMGSWDALTSLAEAKKTVLGIRDRMAKTFLTAERYAREARRRNKNSAKNRIRDFEQLWLEGRYQWRPLVKEIDDLMTHLDKGTQVRQSGRSSASQSLSGSFSAPNVVTTHRIWTRSTSVVGTRTYRGFAMSVGDIASANLNPFQTAWELVPYSFVVDKFIAIGNAINAWVPIPGVDTPASGFSIHDSYTVIDEVEALDNPAVAGTIASYSPYRRVTTVNHYHRWPSGAMVPRLYPRLKPADLMDILLLTTSRVRRVSNLLR